MFQTNESYKTLVMNNKLDNAQIYGTIVSKNGLTINLNENNIIEDSININLQSGSSSIEIGATTINQLDISFYSSMTNYYSLIDAVVKLYYKLDEQEIALGVYNVSEPSRSDNIIKLTCYDNMSRLDESLMNSNANGTVKSVLEWICKKCNVKLSESVNISNFVNSDIIVNVSSAVFSNYIEVLSHVCTCICAFAYFDRNGELMIKKYQNKPVHTIYVDQLFSVNVSDFECNYTQLVTTIDSQVYNSVVASQQSGLVYKLENKIIKGIESEINKYLQNIIKDLNSITYTPCELEITYDPSIDLGDMLTIKADGDYLTHDINIVVTELNFGFGLTMKIKSSGENPYLQNVDVSGGGSAGEGYSKFNGTYIATYENIDAYEIGLTETEVVRIEYTNGSNEINIVNGQAEIDVITPGTLKILYYQDDKKESYETEEYLQKGKNIINFNCFFETTDTNVVIVYKIKLISEDGLVATISTDKIRAWCLGTQNATGRFLTDNVFYEIIDFYKYTSDNYPVGYVFDDDNNG